MDAITTLEQLDAVFGGGAAPSGLMYGPFIRALYGALIAASPYAMVATSGPEGVDASPRGDLLDHGD